MTGYRFFKTCIAIMLVANMAVAGQSDLGLTIQVLQGAGAQNVLEQIPAIPITIRVSDRNNAPVRGAIVVFTAPETGPSGDFASGLNSFNTVTDADGLAIAQQFRPNAIEGTYQIEVRVEHLGEVRTASIRQTNGGRQRSFGKMILIIAAAGAAAGVAAVAAGRGGEGSNSDNPPAPSIPTIAFGRASVGGPQP